MKDLALVTGIILLLLIAGMTRDYKEDQVMTLSPEFIGDWVCTQKGSETTLQLEADGRGTLNKTNWRWGINRLGQFCMAPLDECKSYPFECRVFDLEENSLFFTPKSLPCTRFKKAPSSGKSDPSRKAGP